jgi:regulator of RNase E activity RraB
MSIATRGSAKAIKTATNEHRQRNRKLRMDFKLRGVDFDEPRPIDFHFWAWTQRDAAVVGRELYKKGFLIRLLAPAPSSDEQDRWSVEAGVRISLNEALGDELTEKLVKLAAEEDSVFDGWGTSI